MTRASKRVYRPRRRSAVKDWQELLAEDIIRTLYRPNIFTRLMWRDVKRAMGLKRPIRKAR